MQDVQIGLVMGILPILAGHYEQSKTSFAILPNQGVIHYWLHGATHAGSKGTCKRALLTQYLSCFRFLALLHPMRNFVTLEEARSLFWDLGSRVAVCFRLCCVQYAKLVFIECLRCHSP